MIFFFLTAGEDLTSSWVRNVCNCFLFWLLFFWCESAGWRSAAWWARFLASFDWVIYWLEWPANEHVSLITAINTVFTNTACRAKYLTDWKGGSVCVCVCAYSHVEMISTRSPCSSTGTSSRVLPSPFPAAAAGIAWFVSWCEQEENL